MHLGLSESARATTAEESRFRIDYPNSHARRSRVIALDAASGQALAHLSSGRAPQAHFMRYVETRGVGDLRRRLPVDAVLRDLDGQPRSLSEEIADADIIVMVTSVGYTGEAAEVIGNACLARNKMATGLILGSADATMPDLAATLAAMRPFAAMLVVSNDDEYAGEMLSALRA